MTNREKLKRMTDEELSEWLCNHLDCGDCPITLSEDIYLCVQVKTNPLLEWLRKEAEEEDE